MPSHQHRAGPNRAEQPPANIGKLEAPAECPMKQVGYKNGQHRGQERHRELPKTDRVVGDPEKHDRKQIGAVAPIPDQPRVVGNALQPEQQLDLRPYRQQ